MAVARVPGAQAQFIGLRGATPEVVSRREAPAHRHRPGARIDEPDQLSSAIRLPRHRIRDSNGSGVRRERRLEHVRAGAVAAHGVERRLGLELEAAAVGRVEQAVENGWGVAARQAEPVDRAVATDERRRPPVADQGVVA